MTPAPTGPAETRVVGFALALCWVAALATTLSAAMPPVMDLPNHLARMWLIAQGAREAPLDAVYSVDWTQAWAATGVDAAGAALLRWLPVYVVSRALIALAFLGPPLGALGLSRVLSGRFHVWQLSLLALAWSTTAIAGFIAYQISLAAALIGAAVAARRLESLSVSFALHLGFAVLLTRLHPFGLALYVAAVAALLIGPELSGATRRIWPGVGALAAAVAIPLGAAALLSHTGDRPPLPSWSNARAILDPLHPVTIWFTPVLSYDLRVDLPAAAITVGLVVFALARGFARVHAGLTLAAGALFALVPAAPDAVGDGSWLPQRLPLMAALLFLTGLRPARAAHAWLPVALAVPILARTLWIASIWTSRQVDLTDLQEVLRAVPPGAAVITLQQEPLNWRAAPAGRYMIGSPNGKRATGRHMGALAVIEARAFVPTLFTVPGQHALKVKPGWRDIAVPASSIPSPRQLGAEVSGDPYLKLWRTRFNYVLVLDADLPAATDFAPDVLADLQMVADRGFARLYRVRAPVSASEARRKD